MADGDRDAARRMLHSFAQLSQREMLFVQAIFDRRTVWDAAERAGYRRNNGPRVARSIARRHPEFAGVLLPAIPAPREK